MSALSDGQIIGLISAAGTITTAYFAFRSKKSEKADDAAIARENNVWKENEALRAKIEAKDATIAELREKQLEEKDRLLHVQDELARCQDERREALQEHQESSTRAQSEIVDKDFEIFRLRQQLADAGKIGSTEQPPPGKYEG